MDLQGSCFLFVLVLLAMLLSTKCQLLIPEKDTKCFIEKNKLTLRLRRNEIEREKLKSTVLSLQKDVEKIKNGLNKPINSDSKNVKDEIDALKRSSELFKMQMESFRCFTPGFLEPNPGDYIGGQSGGAIFNDCKAWKGRNITAIRLGCSSLYLFYIQIKYGDVWAVKHGCAGGCNPSYYGIRKVQDVTYVLDTSEYITSIAATMHTTASYMQSITFHTNKRSFPRCGPEDGVRKVVQGTRLLYISGRKGYVIDGLQPHWL